MDREAFIKAEHRRLIDFDRTTYDGPGVSGPVRRTYTCPCGFSTADAGEIFDHSCGLSVCSAPITSQTMADMLEIIESAPPPGGEPVLMRLPEYLCEMRRKRSVPVDSTSRAFVGPFSVVEDEFGDTRLREVRDSRGELVANGVVARTAQLIADALNDRWARTPDTDERCCGKCQYWEADTSCSAPAPESIGAEGRWEMNKDNGTACGSWRRKLRV